VTHLARAVDGITYHEHGSVRLKNLADPVPVITVRREAEDLAQNIAFRRALGPVGVAAVGGAAARNPYK
jgi:class 3 adenylate cyclase